jgi:hypothetical protein
MQINIDKKSGVFIAVIAGLLILIMAMTLSGRSGDGIFGMNHSDSGMMGNQSSQGDLTGADIMLLQMMKMVTKN